MEEIVSAQELYSKYACQFDEKIGVLDLYDEVYKNFVEKSARKKTLLDLASGPGNVSAFITSLLPKLSVTCVDISEEMLSLAKTKMPQVKTVQSDILDLALTDQSFDMIVCAFGLPYIKHEDVGSLVAEISKYSAEKTTIYISCMQGDGYKVESVSFAGDEKVYMYYHAKSEIMDAFEKAGFSLLHYNEQKYPEQDGTDSTDMVFMFEKR